MPCSNEETTCDLLSRYTPTHAVLDLNLGGGGPRFEVAHMMKARGVPFVFVTGYDSEVIPTDLQNIVRLQKPIEYRAVVEAVSRLD